MCEYWGVVPDPSTSMAVWSVTTPPRVDVEYCMVDKHGQLTGEISCQSVYVCVFVFLNLPIEHTETHSGGD